MGPKLTKALVNDGSLGDTDVIPRMMETEAGSASPLQAVGVPVPPDPLLAALLPRPLLLHLPLLLAVHCGRGPALRLLHPARCLLRGQGLRQPQPRPLYLHLHHLRPAQGPGERARLCPAGNQAHWGVGCLVGTVASWAGLVVTEPWAKMWAPQAASLG